MKLTQAQLEDIILYHKYLYYHGKAMIDDYTYDQIEKQLREIAPDSKVLTEYLECPRELYEKYEARYQRYLKDQEILEAILLRDDFSYLDDK